MTKPFTPEEEALAALLERAGLSRAASRLLAALGRAGAWSANELAAATALARQDVSDAAHELEARGLVRTDRVATGGRPAHRYALADDPGAGVRALVAARRRALAEEEAALIALERRFGGHA